VAAMGNDATSTPVYPAAYPDVVAVGAIDHADQRPNWSNTGPHIDVAAPGVGVLSTVWDNNYTTMSGTSMAAPHVSGVAALILSCNSNLTGAQAADIIRQTARPLRDNPADPVPNDSYGFGCVDAKAAVDRACPVVMKSQLILTCPSISNITCPTRTVICQLSVRLPCQTMTVICQPSVRIPCQTETVTCLKPSVRIPCPSRQICGIGPEPSPYATYGYDPYGSGTEDWSAYDPYAYWYGDPDDISSPK